MKTQSKTFSRLASFLFLPLPTLVPAKLLVAALLCLLPAITCVEAAVRAWGQRCHGPGNGSVEAKALAVDRRGNVIVTRHEPGSRGDHGFTTLKCSRWLLRSSRRRNSNRHFH